MAKRKYTKKSDYWNQFNQTSQGALPNPQAEPELLGEPFYTSDASYAEIAKARTQIGGMEQLAELTGLLIERL